MRFKSFFGQRPAAQFSERLASAIEPEGDGRALKTAPAPEAPVDLSHYIVVTGGDGGSGNLGDELLLASAKTLYGSLPHDYRVVILKLKPSPADDRFIYVKDNAEAFDALGIPVDRIVLLHYYGGGYLNDYWYDIKMWLYRHLVSEGLSPSKVVFTGQGILPLSGGRLDELTAVARECASFGYRDTRFEQLKLPGRLTFDDTIAFFDPEEMCTTNSAKVLTLSLRTAYYVGMRPESAERVACEVQSYAGASGLEPIAFGMVKDHGFDEQTELEKILSQRAGGIRVLGRPRDLEELKNRLCGSRVVVTASYHIAVFALYYGIPAIGLFANEYYRNKFEGLQATMNSPFFRAVEVDAFRAGQVEAAVRECTHQCDRNALRSRLEVLQELNRDARQRIQALVEVGGA